jgi:hypothetical protein
MMSPEQFSRQASLWRNITPMIEHVTRMFNISALNFGRSVWSRSNPDRNAFIAETAFRVVANGVSGRSFDSSIAEAQARAFILALPRGASASFPLQTHEWAEVDALVANLRLVIETRPTAVFDHEVDGCGVVTHSRLDAIAQDELIEVKSVQRQFRGSDVRQALTYAALLRLQHMEVNTITLVNPRRGRIASMPMTAVSSSSAGTSPIELLEEIAQLMVGVQLSL